MTQARYCVRFLRPEQRDVNGVFIFRRLEMWVNTDDSSLAHFTLAQFRELERNNEGATAWLYDRLLQTTIV